MLRLQEWIHRFEEGEGARWIRRLATILALVTLAVLFDLRAFKNMTAPEAMDSAQLARNLAEGKGYTTDYIRPFSIYLLSRHRADGNAQLRGGHPDLANAPFYPCLLASWMGVVPFNYQLKSGNDLANPYQPELMIAVLNQLLFFGLLWLVFGLARRLFDEPVAWVSTAALAGSELLWRFSTSGLSTILLLLVFTGICWCLVLLDESVTAGGRASRQVFLAAASGALVALGGLTRYSFLVLIPAVVLFLALAGGNRRVLLPFTALAASLSLMAPWVIRNVQVSGTPFGTAGYAIYEQTSLFPDNQLARSVNPSAGLRLVGTRDLTRKFVVNSRDILQNDVPRLGGNWLGAFFLVALVLPYRDARRRRLRFLLVVSLLGLYLAQALGRGRPPGGDPDASAANLLVIVAPVAFILGSSLFLALLDQLQLPLPAFRAWGCAAFLVVIWLPLLATLMPPKSFPLSYPPYQPLLLRNYLATYVSDQQLTMSDVPWAVAWYADRPCVEWTLNCKQDFLEVHDRRSVAMLYLSPATMGSWFSTVTLRAKADATPGWSNFLLDLLFRKELPDRFPLKSTLADLLPEHLLLADYERWRVPSRSAGP